MLTDDIKTAIKTRYNYGENVSSISRRLGIRYQYVYNYVKMLKGEKMVTVTTTDKIKLALAPESPTPKVETVPKKHSSVCWDLYANIVEGNTKNIPYTLLYGPPGTGKTTQARRLANDRPVFSVTVTEDMTDSQILGHFVPEGDKFRWHDGPAILAWKQGGLLVVNEINRAGGSVLTALYAICDDLEIAQLTLTSGETVIPNKDFYCVSTMNDVPECLPEGLRDRFPIKLLIDYPHPEAIEILTPDMQALIMTSYSSSNVPITFRQARAYQDLVKNGVSVSAACQAVFGREAKDIAATLKLGLRSR